MTSIVRLSEKIPSSLVHELIEQLLSVKVSKVVIDGTEVCSIGAQAGEVLARYKQAIEGSGGEFKILASQALLEDLQVLGLSEYLLSQGT